MPAQYWFSIKYFWWYFLALFLILYSLFFLTSYVYAQEPCADDNDCTDDFYYSDDLTGECIHKYGGYCDIDTNQCVYAFDPVSEDFCQEPEPSSEPSPTPGTSPSPSPSSSPTSSPTSSPPSLGCPEEKAVYNLDARLLPGEVIKDVPTENESWLDKILNALRNLINPLLFKCQPQDKGKVYTQSETIQQSEVPPELKPADQNPLVRFKQFLGDKSGFYPISLPEIPGFNKDSIQKSEEFYENAHFPEGIRPITTK